MSRRRYTPEQIIGKLREAEVALAQGQTAAQVCRTLGIVEQTFYRWRRKYGGLKVEQAKRLKILEQERPDINWSSKETGRSTLCR
jgi:putative transposase